MQLYTLPKKVTGTDVAEAYPDVNEGHLSELRLPDQKYKGSGHCPFIKRHYYLELGYIFYV